MARPSPGSFLVARLGTLPFTIRPTPSHQAGRRVQTSIGDMQMIMKRALAKVALVGVLVTAVATAPRLRAASQENEERGLQGSWEIKITQPDLSPLPYGLDFRILRTVTSEGVVDAYAFPGFGQAGPQFGLVSNSGHGTWRNAGRPRKYNAVVKYFQIDQASFPFVLHSTGTVTEQITVSRDGDSYTSQFVTEIHRPDGTLIFVNSGGSMATRIK